MAITATLRVGGKKYNLNECEFSFYQSVDLNHKPVANPKGGLIKFTMDTLPDKDVTFHKWMFDKTEVKSGSIEFDLPGSDNKTILFEQAHCVALNENFSTTNTPPSTSFLDDLTGTASSKVGSAVESSLKDIGSLAGPIGTAVGYGAQELLGFIKKSIFGGGESSSVQMLTTITISAAIIKVGKEGLATFTNNELLA